MLTADFDVVAVPDFLGPRPLVFEGRTLLFLASWLEMAHHREQISARGGLPALHLACVGEPPASVRRLAERAGASWSVHAPLPLVHGGFANKLRGLEAPPGRGAARRLLLDVDMLVLGPLDEIGLIEADFAAAPAGKPQISEACWREIYAGLGLPAPETRMACLRTELGLGMDRIRYRYPFQEPEAAAMMPYHNSGALLARRDTRLRAVWEEHLRWIAEYCEGMADAPAALKSGDQVALATALHALGVRHGCTFQRLPDAFNVRTPHLQVGARRWRDTRLFHATGLVHGLRAAGDLPGALAADARRWEQALEEGFRLRPGVAAREGRWVRAFLDRLWRRWVKGALNG